MTWPVVKSAMVVHLSQKVILYPLYPANFRATIQIKMQPKLDNTHLFAI